MTLVLNPPPMPGPAPMPGPFQQGLTFAASMLHWIAAGFPVVDEPTHFARSAHCSICPSWDARQARCLACGCYSLKHWLSTEKCPLGNWPAA